jgi:hypothetical protein
MKLILMGSLIVVSSWFSKAQEIDPACMVGDCKTEYGTYFNEETGEVYHGFFENGFYNGVGYRQNGQGYYYMSQFKDGKPNGYTVYNEGGGRTYGLYIDGLKYGSHFRTIEEAAIPTREVINYHQGVLLDRKTYVATPEVAGNCIAGGCKNGFGMARENDLVVIGMFKDNKWIQGEMINLTSGFSQFLTMPAPENMSKPFFKVSLYPDGESVQEVAAMYIATKLNGQYVTVNATTAATGGAIFKDDEPVKKF